MYEIPSDGWWCYVFVVVGNTLELAGGPVPSTTKRHVPAFRPAPPMSQRIICSSPKLMTLRHGSRFRPHTGRPVNAGHTAVANRPAWTSVWRARVRLQYSTVELTSWCSRSGSQRRSSRMTEATQTLIKCPRESPNTAGSHVCLS
jgi:hypothetical protein